jgi:hypothetical protein
MSSAGVADWDRAYSDLFPPTSPWVADPAGWIAERTKEFTWSVQRRICASVVEHRRTAVPSSHGPGKSFIASRIASWWIDAHPPGQAFVVTSAPTDPQVKAILWREIGRAHRLGKLLGRITLDAQWKLDDGELVAFGRKPADIAVGDATETVTAFQGIHARYVLVIFDEASGIPRQLWTAANSLLTNADARFLAIGNPDDPASEFAAICAGSDLAEGGLSDRGWNVVPINTFDTPNFTGEAVPEDLAQLLPSRLWLADFVKDVGGPHCTECEGHVADLADWLGHEASTGHTVSAPPLYLSKVLGRFPRDKADGMVPWSWIYACRGETATARIGDLRVPVELGVDVGASDNGDLTVVRARGGRRAMGRWQVQSGDPEVVATTVVRAAREVEPTRIKVDANGPGWALVAILKRDLPRCEVVPVQVAEAAPDGPNGELYKNLRAALWWEQGRLRSKPGAREGWDLTELDDRALAELAEPRYFHDKRGRIQVEEKHEVKRRLGRSPDDADALLLAFYEPGARQPAAGARRYKDTRLRGRR